MAVGQLFGCGMHRVDCVPADYQNYLACPVCSGEIRDEKAMTDDEVRLLERATKLVNTYGWAVKFTCPHPKCRGSLETLLVERRGIAGGFQLECAHQVVRCVSTQKPRRR